VTAIGFGFFCASVTAVEKNISSEEKKREIKVEQGAM
jgi:hypothetical protein